jgi:aminodeoxyfutalosine deaminase
LFLNQMLKNYSPLISKNQ